MIKSHFDKNNNILFINVFGINDLKDMIKAIDVSHKFMQEPPKKLKILEDASNATVTFDENDLKIITDKLLNHTSAYESIFHAVVHKNSINTALATLVSNDLKNTNYKLKVFSSVEAATNWISQF